MADFSDIECLFLDCDGTLTDGRYHISAHSDTPFHYSNSPSGDIQPVSEFEAQDYISKSFHTRDFEAISRCLKEDIQVHIITASIDSVIDLKLYHFDLYMKNGDSKLSNRVHLHKGIGNKSKLLKDHDIGDRPAPEGDVFYSWDLNKSLYVGDAANDLEAGKLTKYFACPSDAVHEAINADFVDYVSDRRGGYGAVYDILKSCYVI